jgi:hypothetical protein
LAFKIFGHFLKPRGNVTASPNTVN